MRTRRPVLFVAFEDQPNLGVAYLRAVLEAHGIPTIVADADADVGRICRLARSARPTLVGLSLIFQFYLERFEALAAELRRSGASRHLTVGGHYPSLCYEDVLEAMPSIDSVVRFEGELTLLELVETLERGGDWRTLPGIAYRDGSARASATPPRQLVDDLDAIPRPVRPTPPRRVLGVASAPILASRGCARRCSFCSIHAFYRTAPGHTVRVRSPEAVVAEMAALHDEQGVRIFLFQDDDFPVWGSHATRWVPRFLNALREAGLARSVIWKISCRVDEVTPALFGRLRESGLYLVYLGLESGTSEGLATLNKQTTTEAGSRAIGVLEDAGLTCEFGFMLFDPSSTFDSVRQNVAFLRRVVKGNRLAAVFGRMLPYGGTPIHETLAAQGRLLGDVTSPDYTFLEPGLQRLHAYVAGATRPWLRQHGLSHRLNWAWHELAVVQRLFGPVVGVSTYRRRLETLTASSNAELFAIVDEATDAIERGRRRPRSSTCDRAVAKALAEQLRVLRDDFVAQNARAMMATLAAWEEPSAAARSGSSSAAQRSAHQPRP